jgi:TonB family protein
MAQNRATSQAAHSLLLVGRVDERGNQLQTSSATRREADLFFRTSMKRRVNCVKPILRSLAMGALFALLLAQLQGQARQSVPTQQVNSPSAELLSPSEGVDFSAYLTDLCRVVKRNWYAVLPQSAMLGEKGRVVLRLQIQKDGRVAGQTPTVEISSGKKALDKAAIGATHSSAPFKHLPEAFRGPHIEVRLTFLYNQPPEPTQHP